MVKANTSPFDATVLSVEFDPDGSPDVFTTVCGITQWDYSLTTNLDESEVPDCQDVGKPLEIERDVRSVSAQASCSGVWALSSHQNILAWATGGKTLQVKITFGVVTSDGVATDTEVLTGNAFLTNLELANSKGPRMTTKFDLVFDGVPVATVKGP